MAARPACPVKGCGKTAYRTYAQVQSPATHRSTSVPMPAVFCGVAGFADGHGTLTAPKGYHGFQPLPSGTFAAQVRQSRAAVKALVRRGVVRKGGVPVAKAKGKARGAPKAKPKAKPARKAAHPPKAAHAALATE